MGLLSYIPLLNLHIRKKKSVSETTLVSSLPMHHPDFDRIYSMQKQDFCILQPIKIWTVGRPGNKAYVKQAGSLFSFSCCFAQLVDYGWFVYKNSLVRAIYRSWLALFIILPLHGFKISSMCTQRRHPLQCKQQVSFSVHAMAMLMLRAGLSTSFWFSISEVILGIPSLVPRPSLPPVFDCLHAVCKNGDTSSNQKLEPGKALKWD